MSDTGGFSSFMSFLRGKRAAALFAALLVVGALLILPSWGGEKSDGALTDEERLAALFSSIEGVGECRVYITYSPSSYSSSSRVESVAVVCRGASSVAVRSELVEIIASLYGIGANRISVSKMKG